MKRLTALLLSLIMTLSLCACDVNPGQKGSEPAFTEPPVVTLADGSVVYSKEPFVEYPQTGEYKETALLTNVPGQGVPLLLDMRDDGTIDYIFADVEEKADFQNFSDSGAVYYTIAPDGTATKQDTQWMEGIDNYMAQTLETTQDPNGKWRFLFTADEGTVLILAQYHNVRQYPYANQLPYTIDGDILYSVLFKVVDGLVSIIPVEWEVDLGNRTVDLRSKYITSIEMQDGQIIISKRDDILYVFDDMCIATYNMDGTLAASERLQCGEYFLESIYMDDTGLIVMSIDRQLASDMPEWSHVYDNTKDQTIFNNYTDGYWGLTDLFLDPEEIQYTENDSLYYLGKQLPSMKAHAQGSGKDFCCWFNEAGKGVLMRYTYNPEGKIEPEVVTVWSVEPIDLVKTAVAQWNHTHASPIFRYETAEEALEGTHQTLEDELTRLNLELLNNRGPDVLILDGLNVNTYLEFMAPLDRVSTEGVYESIRTRFTIDGDLLAVPARMSPYLLGRLAEGTEDIDSLAQFADLVVDNTTILGTDPNGKPAYDAKKAPYYVGDYVQLFQLWYPAWAEAIWEGGKLNKDVFKEFLTHTTTLSKLYGLSSHGTRNRAARDINSLEDYEENNAAGNLDFFPYLREPDGDMKVQQKVYYPYVLAAPDHVGLYTYWLYTSETAKKPLSKPYYLDAIPGPDGTGAMVPTVVAGVRAGGNEAAGQEFVQILLSRELQLGGGYHSSILVDGYPVMWSATEELVTRMGDYMHQEHTIENDYQEVLNNLRTVVIDETLYKMALYAAHLCYRFSPIDHSNNPNVLDYTHHDYEVLTVDEAVDLLEEMSRIYLAELR